MSKPRKSGSPFEWLLGTKASGYGAGETQAKKGKKGPKSYNPEPEEEEYPEVEEYDEELEGEEYEEEVGAQYAPINTRITITKVAPPSISMAKYFRAPMQEH
jgi:hypothetical protein